MNNEFKAGDFTSGKMGDIFKACFFQDCAEINHKQFGLAYMIPEEIIRVCVLNIFAKQDGAEEYMKGVCGSAETTQDFMKLDQKAQMHFIEDFYEEEFGNWFSILTAI